MKKKASDGAMSRRADDELDTSEVSEVSPSVMKENHGKSSREGNHNHSTWVLNLSAGLAAAALMMSGMITCVPGGEGSTGTSSNPAPSSCSQDVAPLLNAVFSSLGHDCTAYVSLFADDAKYYHQHDGYKSYSELMGSCQGYAGFCPGNDCKFQQNGSALLTARGDTCHMLVPYAWSEVPANSKAKGNLEPHTGWEYIVAAPDGESPLGYKMKHYAEIETSYSVAFNWAKPDDTPAVVAQSALYLLSLGNSASKGECNSPIAPTLTKYFSDKNTDKDTWRQQGDAVVLAAGGTCHVAVPYAALVGGALKTGYSVLILDPASNDTYSMADAVEFPGAVP